jgi:hypothetical protein
MITFENSNTLHYLVRGLILHNILLHGLWCFHQSAFVSWFLGIILLWGLIILSSHPIFMIFLCLKQKNIKSGENRNLELMGSRVPLWVTLPWEQAHAHWWGTNNANALLLQIRHQIQQRGVIEAVVAVGKYQLYGSLGGSVQHVPESQHCDASQEREKGRKTTPTLLPRDVWCCFIIELV